MDRRKMVWLRELPSLKDVADTCRVGTHYVHVKIVTLGGHGNDLQSWCLVCAIVLTNAIATRHYCVNCPH